VRDFSSTGPLPRMTPSEAGRLLGLLGASKGGTARAVKLSRSKRQSISSRAGIASGQARRSDAIVCRKFLSEVLKDDSFVASLSDKDATTLRATYFGPREYFGLPRHKA
jgi:hypothetical protein